MLAKGCPRQVKGCLMLAKRCPKNDKELFLGQLSMGDSSQPSKTGGAMSRDFLELAESLCG